MKKLVKNVVLFLGLVLGLVVSMNITSNNAQAATVYKDKDLKIKYDGDLMESYFNEDNEAGFDVTYYTCNADGSYNPNGAYCLGVTIIIWTNKPQKVDEKVIDDDEDGHYLAVSHERNYTMIQFNSDVPESFDAGYNNDGYSSTGRNITDGVNFFLDSSSGYSDDDLDD